MTTRVRLDKQELSRAEGARIGLFRMVLTVAETLTDGMEGSLLPLELFLYQREVLDATEGLLRDTCIGVCSLPDVAAYPINEPDEETEYAFFRKSYAVYDWPNISGLDDIYADTLESLATLADVADKLEVLGPAVSAWVPSAP